jgi:transposase
VAVHIVKMACERPEQFGRSLAQWDCAELARTLVRDGIVDAISPATVRRVLQHHKLKPWRHHLWLSPKHPRDGEFYRRVEDIIDIYTRDLGPDEIVYSLDEKTSIQPRPRTQPTRPAQPGTPGIPGKPTRVEHEYRRAGALNLFAAFDTRTGRVIGRTYDRKRQVEFIDFLEHLERETPGGITRIHLVCDNVPTHHGKLVKAWLASHQRFIFHFTPVHCSWMNQVEQWFSILSRKRLSFSDFPSKDALAEQLQRFIAEWNEACHPFKWSTKSAAKVMADAPTPDPIAA